MRLSCKDNKIDFTIEDVVLSCKALARACGRDEHEVYMATAQKRTGPYTVAVSEETGAHFVGDTVNIFKTKTDEDADFEVTELDENGFSEASRTRYSEANAQRAARRAVRQVDNKTIRLFVDLPDTYMIKPLGEFNELADKVMDTYKARLEALAGSDGVRINVISVESSEIEGLPYNTFLIFADFKDKDTRELAAVDFSSLKYCDDGVSNQMARARMPRRNLENLNLSACCLRPRGACEDERKVNGNRCLVQDRAYEQRRKARRQAGPSEEYREARAREKQVIKDARKRAREEAQAQAEVKSKEQCAKACSRWLAGKCYRDGKCSRRHTNDVSQRDDGDIRTTDTACIDCASLVGGSNYDEKWVCKFGESRCPYNHVVARAQ